MCDMTGPSWASGEWVGTLALSNGDEVAIARLGDEDRAPGEVDLPNRLLFGVRISSVRAEGNELEIACVDDALTFVGERHGELLRGRVRIQGDFGSAVFERTSPVDIDTFRPLTGEYLLHDGRQIFIGLVDDEFLSEPRCFYADGDDLVRLYPRSATEFRSERGEAVSIETHLPSTTVTVEWRGRADVTKGRRVAPYAEDDVEFASPGGRLSGTLLLPHSEGPHPAVVLLHGSAPKKRDFYRVYARHFVAGDVAALIYDGRGYGASSGSGESTIFERADDAEAAVDYLQSRADIGAVGLWAFSNGSWSAPVVAARRPDVDFLIAVGAAGVSMAEAETHRRIAELRQGGMSEEILDDVANCWRLAFRYIAHGELDAHEEADLDRLLRAIVDSAELRTIPLQHFVSVDPMLSPVPPWASLEELRRDSAGPDEELIYDPIEDYRRVRCPVLFLVGELDQNLPSATSADRVERALRDAGHRDFRVVVYPGTDHMMNLEPGGSGAAPFLGLHQFRFASGFLATMTHWISSHVRRPDQKPPERT
jgi:pimeloyl-ACP methyl ester carboxylesterase